MGELVEQSTGQQSSVLKVHHRIEAGIDGIANPSMMRHLRQELILQRAKLLPSRYINSIDPLVSRHPKIGVIEVDEVDLPRLYITTIAWLASIALGKVQPIGLLQALTIFISHGDQLALPLTNKEVATTVTPLIQEGFFSKN